MERVSWNDIWVTLLSVCDVMLLRRLVVAVGEDCNGAVLRNAGACAWSRLRIWRG